MGGNSGEETQGRDHKKSRNLIAVLCCFCEWFDFGVCAVSGWGCGQRGRCPSHELVFLLPMSGSFLLFVYNSSAAPAADRNRVQKKRAVSDAPVTWLCVVLSFMDFLLFDAVTASMLWGASNFYIEA